MIRLLRDFVPPHVPALLISEATLFFCCFTSAAYFTFEPDPAVYLLEFGGLRRVLLVEALLLVSMCLVGLYSDILERTWSALAWQSCQVWGFALMAQALVGYVRPAWLLPRWLMLTAGSLGFLAFLGWRALYRVMARRVMEAEKVLFVGSTPLCEEIAAYLDRHPELGATVIGRLAAGDASQLAAMASGAAAVMPNRIVVTAPERGVAFPLTELLALRASGVVVEDAGAAYERVFKRVAQDEQRGAQFVFAGANGAGSRALLVQSLLSGVFALVALLVCVPLMALVAAAARLASVRPLLSRDVKLGWRARPFRQYRFRPNPLLRRLRLAWLEETPSLYNVVRGDMAFVGPQPVDPDSMARRAAHVPFYNYRLAVLPGMTGWAQVHLGQPASDEDAALEFSYDLYYIHNAGFWMDLFIVLGWLQGPSRRRTAA
jgi:lipopolysaccharide/colanic/teichoic acid biosynthesis glycosyltransferase